MLNDLEASAVKTPLELAYFIWSNINKNNIVMGPSQGTVATVIGEDKSGQLKPSQAKQGPLMTCCVDMNVTSKQDTPDRLPLVSWSFIRKLHGLCMSHKLYTGTSQTKHIIESSHALGLVWYYECIMYRATTVGHY